MATETSDLEQIKESLRTSLPWSQQREPQEVDDDPTLISPWESMLGTAIAIGAGMAARDACEWLWKKRRGESPPTNPAASTTSWKEALLWAGLVGATAGIARMVGRRSTTAAVRRLR